ncbi:chorismate mutase [Fructilactobacillus ixorae]|uniref:Chorismate mutase n=1 Tax=Fructilactobacillus ixorae TaxID=1750535 RepID=A0ABY5C308_9LACO|nr:chorismate mutase [Fructilactobacillus ixorae]USS93170.1 chorismate mutase [Fructilactobacillus ixorae]
MTELEQQRQRINQLDDQIISLLEERLQVATDIANYKARQHQPVYDERREATVYQHLHEVVRHAQLLPYLTTIYSTIMQTTRNLEQHQQEENHA